MADLDYSKFNWVPSAKERREGAVKQSTGIGAKPADQQEPMDRGFYENMYDAIMTYFDNAEEADRVLTAKEIDKDRVKGEVLREFDALDSLLSEDTETPSLDAYQAKDIDARMAEFDAQVGRYRDAIPAQIYTMESTTEQGNELKDVTDTEEGKLTNEEPLYELAEEIDPGTIETKGIMSKPSDDSADGVQPTDGKDFEIPEYKVYESPDEMSELEILARTIEAEAALEPYKGKIAVGATIANRASSGSYGKDIRGVILRRGQFSPWNSWTGYAKGEQGKNMMKLKASEDSYKAANAILTGNYEDPTDGATHYVNEKVSKPAWLGDMKGRKRGTLTIGNHLFGNADSNKKYDGKNWIESREKRKTSPRPMLRPEEEDS